ncbi:hypothetical protein SAY86_022570 [Trapa natans]|uniref:NAC domain-containing protein n=1 Tax=Trapa natans TaxID=22666 RepID=A0AAN7LTR3_TRANT|nr:hypothetical protein SAY86_022570 [Trapa natans]
MATGEKSFSMKKLPVGYRLNPTDEDLVNHHLKRKLQGTHEKYCLIPEYDIYELPPWDLISVYNALSDLESDGRECFFFYRRAKTNGNRHNRRTKEGYWKVTGEGRKPRDTDQIKWLRRILVFYTGKQKSPDKTKTDWVMHEWENISNTSIVICRISKSKSKKGRVKVDSVSSEASPIQSPGSTSGSEIQTEPQKTSPNATVMTVTESPNLTPISNVNSPNLSISSPQQANLVAEERLSLPKVPITGTLRFMDPEYPQGPPIPWVEQPPCCENASIAGSDQRDENFSHSGDVTLEEDADTPIFLQMLACQSPGLAEFLSPQQHCFYHGDVGLGKGGNLPMFDLSSNYAMEVTPFLHMTQDLPESPAETQDLDVDSMLDSFLVSSPPYNSGETLSSAIL